MMTSLLIALTLILSMAAPAAAQYGGISGLFVSTSPDAPNEGDFSGLGCPAGSEVILYFPGLSPTSSDPTASQSVPGRIVAVATAVTDTNGLLNGSFSFPNVPFPNGLEPGLYLVNSRCGSLDMSVTIRVSADGTITVEPITPGSIDPNNPNSPNFGSGSGGNNGFLPFTGANSSRLISLGAGLLAAGAAAISLSRRDHLGRSTHM